MFVMEQKTNSWVNERGQLVLLFAGVAGLLFMMYLLDNLINPLGYGLLIGIVLYPIRRQPVARALLYATAFAAGLWLIYDSGHLLIPFILAYLIAFLINPLVSRLEKRKVPRGLIATLFTIGSLGLIALVFFLATPALIEQLTRMGHLLTEATNDTESWMRQMGIFALIDRLGFTSEAFKSQLVQETNVIIQDIYQNITHLSSGVLSGFGNLVTVLFFIILLPFLSFFMIRDYDKIGGFFRYLLTPQGVSDEYTREISRIIGAYLRGQFIVVVISAVNLSIGFYLFGVPYALVLGLFAGFTNFIPTFGLWVSVSVCTIVGATMGDPWYQFLPGIYIVFAVEQVLETGFIVPRIVGKHVGLHPLLVMVSLLLFGFMFGIIGLLIAVPTVALLSIFYEQYKETRKISFLSGSELDSFLQHFERESSREKEQQKEQEFETSE